MKFFAALLTLLCWCCSMESADAARNGVLKGCFGTYGGAPRLQNGRVDLDRLLDELKEIRANTYNWLIFFKKTDWDDLQLFLPRARAQNIKVWATVVPPSESPPHSGFYSEPFRLDYNRWAKAIAQLSLKETNLVAWSIDDFPYDLDTFTPAATKKILDEAHAINPTLAFVPCCYFSHLKPKFIKTYAALFDAILFPYRNESVRANTTDATHVASELKTLRQRLGPSVPIIVDIYATKHSQHAVSNADYVRDVMLTARSQAEGVMIYCHQDKSTAPAKYDVIKQLFNRWAAEPILYTPKMMP